MWALRRLLAVGSRPPRVRAVLAALALAGFVAAPASARPPSTLPLSGGWEFQSSDGSGWQAVSVPHVFDPQPLAGLFRGTVGWYRLTFTPPLTPVGFDWAIRFEQVRRVATVWLNGVQIASHSDPYTPFDVPSGQLRAGQPNQLVVRVDNRKGDEPREGWWNWGGITRPVELVPQGPVALADPALMPRLSCTGPDRCSAGVLFDGWLTNRTPRPQPAAVQVRLTPPAGGSPTTAGATAGTLAPGQTRRVRFTFPVAGTPQLWAPGHPALYGAHVRTLAGGQLSQADTLHVGLRSIVVRDGVLLLNGRAVALSGASIEEDMPGHGPALTDRDMDTIVSELQAVHANVTRAQYPLNPRLLDRLDRAGILVWSQAPIYHRDELLLTPAQRQAALDTLRGSVLLARGHASVMTHSVANELSPTPDTTPPTRAYLDAASTLARDLDPTVPIALDLLSYPGYPRQSTYARFDLLGINNYFGWYPGRAPHATGNIADLRPYLLTMRRQYPGQGLVMTEFGAEATIAGPTSKRQTFAFQSNYVRRTLSIVRSLPFMNGAIYWTLREFAVKPDWVGGQEAPGVLHDTLHHKGLISYAGAPKPAWTVVRDAFAATPLYRPFPVLTGAPSARPWSSVLAVGALLALVMALLTLDLWLFGRIRTAARRRGWAPRIVRLPDEQPAPERTYA